MIKLEDVIKMYKMGEEEIYALNEINLNIKKGEFVSIVGPSGSGKTTIMNILGLLDIPNNGKYTLDGIEVSKMSDNELSSIRNKKIGFIFQNFNLLSKLTAIENVTLPLMYNGVFNKKAKKLAGEYLEELGLKGREHHLPSQLSGGQQQRVAIARALICNPDIILADEPTGALDSKTGIEVINILQKLNEKGKTIILITHDLELAKKSKRIVKIFDGKICEDGEKA